MKRIFSFITAAAVISAAGAYAASYSPDELIENFYSSRKLMRKTALELLGYSKLSGTGRRAAEEVLYDYTVIDTATSGNSLSYAEVEVKKRTVDSGIRVQREFWKMIKEEGRWVIKNIYTPEEWQIKKAVRKGSSLPEKVEALASFEFEYQVDEVPSGTPLQKAYAYISRKDFTRALYWADLSVRQRNNAESYFIRGLLNIISKKQAQGQNDLMIAIKKDPRYYYVLQSLMNRSSGGGGSTVNQDPVTRTMKGSVRGLFQ